MRGHANFIEYTPLFFIMLFLLEYMETPSITLHVLAIIFLVGIINHDLLFSFLTVRGIKLRTLKALFLAALINFVHSIESFNWILPATILSVLPCGYRLALKSLSTKIHLLD